MQLVYWPLVGELLYLCKEEEVIEHFSGPGEALGPVCVSGK